MKRKELTFLLLGDFIALNAAWFIFFWMRVHSGWFVFSHGATDVTPQDLPLASLFLYGFWMVLFVFFGLYRPWYIRSPFDEAITILKTLGVGTVLLAFVMWWDPTQTTVTSSANDPRILAVTYFLLTSALCVGTRLFSRQIQRKLLESGIGTRTSIIIGTTDLATDLATRVLHYPRLGYKLVGFVTPNESVAAGPVHLPMNGKLRDPHLLPYLGHIEELENVIEQNDVKEVLITLGSNEHDKLIDVIARASKSNAGLKIVPDLYDIVSGQARAREIYGFPLIDINPVILRPWEEAAKRTLDVVISAAALAIGSPVWLLTALAVKTTSSGPMIYSQERVGMDGKKFRIYKFRSMHVNAETGTPQWASKNDPRVTALGKFLRKSHLDEIPQFWNVLKGDMSLVGPRPEREFFVKQLVQEIPYYNRRHKVRPGITGLYQATIDKYDTSVDDVRQRVKYDLMYIESMSFRLDMKILFRTAYMMMRGRGQA